MDVAIRSTLGWKAHEVHRLTRTKRPTALVSSSFDRFSIDVLGSAFIAVNESRVHGLIAIPATVADKTAQGLVHDQKAPSANAVVNPSRLFARFANVKSTRRVFGIFGIFRIFGIFVIFVKSNRVFVFIFHFRPQPRTSCRNPLRRARNFF